MQRKKSDEIAFKGSVSNYDFYRKHWQPMSTEMKEKFFPAKTMHLLQKITAKNQIESKASVGAGMFSKPDTTTKETELSVATAKLMS